MVRHWLWISYSFHGCIRDAIDEVFTCWLDVGSISTLIIWCDNQSVIILASNPKFYCRTKHIELGVHFLREKVANKSFQIQYVPSLVQIVDIVIKAISSQPFYYRCSKVNIILNIALEGENWGIWNIQHYSRILSKF